MAARIALGRLLESALAARANQRSCRLTVALEPHGLEVGGHATVRADAVHTH